MLKLNVMKIFTIIRSKIWFIKANVYVEKVKLIVFPRAYIMLKQARKPFIVGTNYQCTIKTGTLVSYLISSCGNNHYISLVVQIDHML